MLRKMFLPHSGHGHGPAGSWAALSRNLNMTTLLGISTCVLLLILTLTASGLGSSGSISSRDARIADLEAKMTSLSNAASRAQLDISSHVQRALIEQMSAMNGMNGPPAAGGDGAVAMYSRNFMVVPSLPGNLKRRILVTGGAGFVGSHLVDTLMMQGHYVYVLDNLFTGRSKNIQHWIGHPNFQFFQHDVVEPFMLEVDQIYHLACPASPPHYQFNAIKTLKTSTIGTANMLGLAKRVHARLLFTSTSEVYGDPEEHPQKETYWGNVNTMGPRSCYDEGKRVAETLCYSYSREEGVEVRIARIFNTFGPRMHPNDGRVVSNFIMQALQGKPLTIYGAGEQTRSFQYVSDLVAGLIKLMNSDYDKPVNVGNPEEFTIKDFAEKIRAMINPGAKIELKSGTKDDPRRRQPDISLAKKVMNWSPIISVDEGLYYTIQYFKDELGVKLSADAVQPKPAWKHRDTMPLWIASTVNGQLTDKEKCLIDNGVFEPKQPE